MGDNGVGIQLIGAVIGLLPVFRRVVIAVLLGGGGAGTREASITTARKPASKEREQWYFVRMFITLLRV